MENNTNYHIPVLFNECIEGLAINPDGIYVDVTFGGGGHSRGIFEKLSAKGRLISFDQDPDAIKNTWQAPNFQFQAANFSFISNHLRLLGIKKVDGILADLGVSSHQFDTEQRGFSIRGNAPLDMRMNQNGKVSAMTIVSTYEENELIRIFKTYGEVPNARKVASELVKARGIKKIRTTEQLMEALKYCAPKFKEHKYFAQIFQALRIEVNNELDVLEQLLLQSSELLNEGGRFVVMSYHSLEDRLVKNYFKRGSLDGTITKDFFGNVLKPFEEITRHPVVPSEEETERNTRARSAKLRIAVKK
ncbi:MAG: 16S rRNA (cytosine(1402)-N(4))-methyltransferase RsmH [Bacteroidota bacterium]